MDTGTSNFIAPSQYTDTPLPVPPDQAGGAQRGLASGGLCNRQPAPTIEQAAYPDRRNELRL